MYMLDTNICIYILKQRPESLRRKFKAIRHLMISSITYAELAYGIENGEPALRKERYRQLHQFTRKLTIEPWGEAAARSYAQVRAALKREGRSIGSNDLLIGAHAISCRAVLVTNNSREFSYISGLPLENWV